MPDERKRALVGARSRLPAPRAAKMACVPPPLKVEQRSARASFILRQRAITVRMRAGTNKLTHTLACSLARARTHAARARTHTRAHIHARTRTRARTHTHTHTHTHTLHTQHATGVRTRTRTRARGHKPHLHARTHARTHAHTHARTHARTYVRAHTHAHIHTHAVTIALTRGKGRTSLQHTGLRAKAPSPQRVKLLRAGFPQQENGEARHLLLCSVPAPPCPPAPAPRPERLLLTPW